MASITKPLIHLNGSAGDRLYDEYSQAANAVHAAITAVEKAAPNARDYYPQGDSAYAAARAEHELRIRRLGEIHDELSAIYEHISNQLDARERQRR